jgi:glutamate-1-semialdehyde 2,1-aminomutase
VRDRHREITGRITRRSRPPNPVLQVELSHEPVMAHAATIPVSSTFSGDTLSLAAALATVDIYENQGVIEHLWARGEQLTKDLNEISTRHAFPMQVKGRPPCAAWSVGGENWNAVVQTHAQSASSFMDTFIDACYANGVSLYTVLYPNFAHIEADITEALERIDQAVSSIKLD